MRKTRALGRSAWIPACAGMTMLVAAWIILDELDPRLRGDDDAGGGLDNSR